MSAFSLLVQSLLWVKKYEISVLLLKSREIIETISKQNSNSSELYHNYCINRTRNSPVYIPRMEEQGLCCRKEFTLI